jgi:hypothetical protein
MKPLICWAIVSKDGRTIDASSVSHTRRSAIAKWSDMVQPWKYWRDKRGWRAAKVTISLADEARARDAQMRAEGRVAGLRAEFDEGGVMTITAPRNRHRSAGSAARQ